MIDSIGLPSNGCEPTVEELAVIEAEWPLIEVELAELDAEIAEILHGPAAAAVVEPAPPVVRPVVLLGWAAVLSGPGVAFYAVGDDLAGYAGEVPAGPVYGAAAVIAAVAVVLVVQALWVSRGEACDAG